MSLYLIAYDIADPRRLSKVARFMGKYAVRVQYSVFAAELSERGLAYLLAGLEAIIDPRRDDVRAYSLPRNAEVTMLGRQIFPEDILLLNNGYNILRLNTDALPAPEQDFNNLVFIDDD